MSLGKGLHIDVVRNGGNKETRSRVDCTVVNDCDFTDLGIISYMLLDCLWHEMGVRIRTR